MASEETVLFYKCRKSCMRLDFDKAMEKSFRCPECNGKMAYAANQGDVKVLEEKINALQQILSTPVPTIGESTQIRKVV